MHFLKYVISLFLLVMILFLATGPTHAKNEKKNIKYQGMDQNNDNKISRNEWRINSDRSFDSHDWNDDDILSGIEVRPGEHRSVVTNLFRTLDRNNNGIVSLKEWTGTRQNFERLDQNNDGVLNAKEIQQYSSAEKFSEFDRNNDGVLSHNEWHDTIQSFERLDTNRDKKLNRDEFYHWQKYSSLPL